MKKVVLSVALSAGLIVLGAVPSSAKKGMDATANGVSPIVKRPLVLETFPIDLSAFSTVGGTGSGPFDFVGEAGVGRVTPIVPFGFTDPISGEVEPALTFRGLDPDTEVKAGIDGAIFVIQGQQEDPTACDKEIFIAPDSPVESDSWSLYFDHIIPDPALEAAIANGPIRVTSDTVIGKVGRLDGYNSDTGEITECGGPGWLEITTQRDYPIPTGQELATHYAAFCPTLFIPAGRRAPKMPAMPPLIESLFKRSSPLAGADTKPPKLVGRTPKNGATEVKKTTVLKLRFNEPVVLTSRTDFKLSITQDVIRNVWSIYPGDPRITVNGKTVTVRLTGIPLSNGYRYHVKIDTGMFLDASMMNMYEGINYLFDWYFSVGPSTKPWAPKFYSAKRSLVQTQIREIMRRFNIANDSWPDESGIDYSDAEMDKKGCVRRSYADEIVRGG